MSISFQQMIFSLIFAALSVVKTPLQSKSCKSSCAVSNNVLRRVSCCTRLPKQKSILFAGKEVANSQNHELESSVRNTLESLDRLLPKDQDNSVIQSDIGDNPNMDRYGKKEQALVKRIELRTVHLATKIAQYGGFSKIQQKLANHLKLKSTSRYLNAEILYSAFSLLIDCYRVVKDDEIEDYQISENVTQYFISIQDDIKKFQSKHGIEFVIKDANGKAQAIRYDK